MKIGGYVLHANNIDTLGPCLDSLLEVCDEVVAIDSTSTDGSAAIVDAKGVRRIVFPWQGYGAARARAAKALKHCDWIFFLDSDERLAEGAAEAFARWRRSNPQFPHYRLVRRDWAELPKKRFLFRSETHVRLVRSGAATWTPDMVVHESLPKRQEGTMKAVIDHRFATTVEQLVDKQERYATLWALRAFRAGKRAKLPLLQRPAHLLRDCLLKGAFFRGGSDAVTLAWGVSNYHALKHERLRAMRLGANADLVDLYEREAYEELFHALST